MQMDMEVEESICKIEIRRDSDDDGYYALVETQLGGSREFTNKSLEVLLRDMVNLLEDEFEDTRALNPI